MKKHLAATAAATALLLTLATAPALASDEPEHHPLDWISSFAWANEDGDIGWINHPHRQCYDLRPAIEQDAIAVNGTRHKALFYPAPDCQGEPTFELGALDVTRNADTNAASVRFVPRHARPDVETPTPRDQDTEPSQPPAQPDTTP